MEEFIEVAANASSLVRRKLVYGVGVNDAPYITEYRGVGPRVKCPYYRKWISMLGRCYDKAFRYILLHQ